MAGKYRPVAVGMPPGDISGDSVGTGAASPVGTITVMQSDLSVADLDSVVSIRGRGAVWAFSGVAMQSVAQRRRTQDAVRTSNGRDFKSKRDEETNVARAGRAIGRPCKRPLTS
jgi:hypothetical protein